MKLVGWVGFNYGIWLFYSVIKGITSSRSEQTFKRAWNRCPSMNTVTENYWLIYAAATVM